MEKAKPEILPRREFIAKTACSCVALALAACGSDSDPNPSGGNNNPGTGSGTLPFTLDLTQAANASLNTVGGFVTRGKVIVMNLSSGFQALSLVCTHEGCTTAYSGANSKFVCPCHGSEFSDAGAVLKGPAADPLARFVVTVNGNLLTVSAS